MPAPRDLRFTPNAPLYCSALLPFAARLLMIINLHFNSVES